jgi:hypothetical protein
MITSVKSLERWSFWKQRFSDIAATEELESSVRDCARRAADEMGTIGGPGVVKTHLINYINVTMILCL